MAFFNNNDDIYYLIEDFSNKIKNGEKILFYDIDDWLDIIDFFFLEDKTNPLLIKATDLAVNQYPSNENLIVRKAECISLNDYDAALSYLLSAKKQLKGQKQLTLLAYQGAKILNKSGDYKNAKKVIEDCLKRETNEYLLLLLGKIHFNEENYEEAFFFYIKAILLCLDNTMENKSDTIRSYGANDYMFSETIVPDDLLYSSIELCNKCPQYKHLFYQSLDLFPEYDPTNLGHWELVAEFAEKCEDYDKALKICDLILEKEPNDLDLIRRKYINYINCGYKEERVSLLKRIISLLEKELNNEDLDKLSRRDLLDGLTATYSELTSVYIEEERYAECIKLCKEILRKNTKLPILSEELVFSRHNIYFILSRSYFKEGDYNSAKEFAIKSMREEPNNLTAKINYIELLYMMGEVDAATERYQTLYESLLENIANEKAKEDVNKYEIGLQYTFLTVLIISWTRQLFLNDKSDDAFDLLNALIEELFVEDYMEENVTSVLLTYAEIVFKTQSSIDDLSVLIQRAIMLYGNSILENLKSSIWIQNNSELINDLRDIITSSDNEELH